jgi:hypothetical protein
VKRLVAIAVVTICSLINYELGALAQDNLQKLSGAQIRAKFTGMRFTDEVHWGEVYGPNGSLTSQDMGRKRVGTWRIQRDELCTDLGKDVGSNCYEVWMSGKNVQLRPSGSGLPLDGILEKPAGRN